MKSVYNLRLPPELCEKIEFDAQESKLSINQYISYVLTKSISYNDAMKRVKRFTKKVDPSQLKKALNKVPNKKPMLGDELS